MRGSINTIFSLPDHYQSADRPGRLSRLSSFQCGFADKAAYRFRLRSRRGLGPRQRQNSAFRLADYRFGQHEPGEGW